MSDLKGINLAMQTPMHGDGIIDFARWQELIDTYIDAGVHGLVLGAGTGQHPYLSQAECNKLYELGAARIDGRCHLICQTSAPSKVWSCDEVMRDQALLGTEVIVLDEGGNWRGTGTAWHLADKGHQVTIVTPDAYVAKELTRTTADEEIRRNLSKAGARFMVESVIEHWHGDSADVRSLLDGRVSRIEASALVTATTNMACNDIELALNETDSKFYVIGDCASPRSAPYAFHEGRKVGLSL